MKRHHLLSATLLASSPLSGCALPVDEDVEAREVGEDAQDVELQEEKIVGGTVDKKHESVVYVGADEGGDWCSGVLIGTKTVLTAAHCLQGYHNDWVPRLYVRFSHNGKKYYGDAERDPEYRGSQEHDIGIIRLDRAIRNVKPSPYSTTAVNVGERITVVAYGQTSPNSDMSTVRLSTQATIKTANSTYFTFTNPPGGYTCWGDSGGPDFVTRNGVDVVVGVDSSGPCKPNKTIWDPQVSASSDFIEQASRGNARAY